MAGKQWGFGEEGARRIMQPNDAHPELERYAQLQQNKKLHEGQIAHLQSSIAPGMSEVMKKMAERGIEDSKKQLAQIAEELEDLEDLEETHPNPKKLN